VLKKSVNPDQLTFNGLLNHNKHKFKKVYNLIPMSFSLFLTSSVTMTFVSSATINCALVNSGNFLQTHVVFK
jgi:hypothetical protein